MAKTINQNKDIILAIVVGLVLTITGIYGMYISLSPSSIQTVEAVATSVEVTAVVQEWMTITSDTTSTTLSPDLVSTAGALSIGASGAIALTAKTNSADGYTITITGLNDGLDYGATSTINSVNDAATTTIVAGTTEGYGANATSTESSVGTYYDNYGTHALGSIRTGGQTLSSGAGATDADGHVTTMKIEAAVDSNLQESGSYTDTVTLTITGSA